MEKEIVSEGQTLLDLAAQKYGSIEAVFALAKDNGFDSITDDVEAGTMIAIDSSKVRDNETVSFLRKNNLRLNTGSSILTISERVFDDSFDETFN